MESSINAKAGELEMLEVKPCENGYEFGFLIGQRFSKKIRSRLEKDLILQNQLLPFAQSPHSQPFLKTLFENNQKKYPKYWDELRGTAQGSGTPFLQAFTLNSVPPADHEIEVGAIGRNFISRDLLEAMSIDDALAKINSSEASVGHSYNLIELKTRRILNVETASRKRVSVHEIGAVPFFHGNMYLHLQVQQVKDENSLSRQKRAALMPRGSKIDFQSILGDENDTKYPIYMTGPLLYTLCTVVIDLDEKTMSIIEGNPKVRETSFVFSMSCDQ